MIPPQIVCHGKNEVQCGEAIGEMETCSIMFRSAINMKIPIEENKRSNTELDFEKLDFSSGHKSLFF